MVIAPVRQLHKNAAKTRVTILGVTGSVGVSALKIIAAHPDKFDIVGLISHSKWSALAQLTHQFDVPYVALDQEKDSDSLKDSVAPRTQAHFGLSGVKHVLDQPTDIVIAAIVGAQGLVPTLYAMQPGRRLALANKECLVSAGPLFMRTAHDHDVELLPVDSEHNALFQCLVGQDEKAVHSMVITASGGPFLKTPLKALGQVTSKQALNHPIWAMGPKISIDCATMMNKGLELIEAHHLFGLSPERLSALVHPQSSIHGMVYYTDGSVLAHLGVPDMQVPLAFCLGWPERLAVEIKRFDLAELATLHFMQPDLERFACFDLSQQALKNGPGATNCLNAANEIAVSAFLAGDIGFLDISALCAAVIADMDKNGELKMQSDLHTIMLQDEAARKRARSIVTCDQQRLRSAL